MPRVDRCLSLRNFHREIFSSKVRFIKKNRKGNRKNFQLHTYMSISAPPRIPPATGFGTPLSFGFDAAITSSMFVITLCASCHSQIVHVALFGPSYRQYYATFGKIMLCYVINFFLAYQYVFAPAAATLSTIDLSILFSSSRNFCIC